MTTTRRQVRVAIITDVYDQPTLTTLIWARRSADTLTSKLWEHGVLAHIAYVEIDQRQST
jgi:hypothetical protein